MKHSLRNVFCLLLVFFLQAAPAENRFLFIVDTSAGMKRCAPEMERSIQELIMSDIDKQMRRGDTLAIWTFNEELRAGRFPLQIWSPENRLKVADSAIQFLKTEPYEKKAHFEKIIPELTRVTESSDAVVIFIFTDGTTVLNGTLFDKEVNSVFVQHREELRKSKIPFVVVLLGRNGKLVNFSMNSTAGPILIPPPPRATEIMTSTVKKSANKIPTVPRAIPETNTISVMHGAPTNAPGPGKPVVTNLPEPAPISKAEIKPPDSAPIKTETSKPPPVTPTPPPVQQTPAPATQSRPVEVGISLKNPAPQPTNFQTADSTPTLKPTTNSVAPIAPSQPDAIVSQRPSPVVPAKNSNLSTIIPTIQKNQTSEAAHPSPRLAAQVAASTPPQKFLTTKKIFISVAVVFSMVVLFGLLLRRARSRAPQASLITRSLEKPAQKR